MSQRAPRTFNFWDVINPTDISHRDVIKARANQANKQEQNDTSLPSFGQVAEPSPVQPLEQEHGSPQDLVLPPPPPPFFPLPSLPLPPPSGSLPQTTAPAENAAPEVVPPPSSVQVAQATSPSGQVPRVHNRYGSLAEAEAARRARLEGRRWDPSSVNDPTFPANPAEEMAYVDQILAAMLEVDEEVCKTDTKTTLDRYVRKTQDNAAVIHQGAWIIFGHIRHYHAQGGPISHDLQSTESFKGRFKDHVAEICKNARENKSFCERSIAFSDSLRTAIEEPAHLRKTSEKNSKSNKKRQQRIESSTRPKVVHFELPGEIDAAASDNVKPPQVLDAPATGATQQPSQPVVHQRGPLLTTAQSRAEYNTLRRQGRPPLATPSPATSSPASPRLAVIPPLQPLAPAVQFETPFAASSSRGTKRQRSEEESEAEIGAPLAQRPRTEDPHGEPPAGYVRFDEHSDPFFKNLLATEVNRLQKKEEEAKRRKQQ